MKSKFHQGRPAVARAQGAPYVPSVKWGVPRPKAHISPSQQRLARTPETHHNGESVGVIRTPMIGGAQGLGMMSTVHSAKCLCPVVESLKGCAPGTVRPGNRRRGHAHRPSNMTGMAVSPTALHYQQREGEKLLQNLRRFHVTVLFRKSERLTSQYRMQRAALLEQHPLMIQQVQSIEQMHLKTLAR